MRLVLGLLFFVMAGLVPAIHVLVPNFEIPGSRFARPGMTLATLGSLRTLRAVLRPALFAVLDALGVEHAAQDVVAHARQVLDATAADHHHRMFLKIVPFARDVADHLEAVSQ